jgi:hypothetical protein
MSGADISKQVATIEKLQGQADYRSWSLAVKALARFGNCWDAICGVDEAISNGAADVAAFRARENKAIGLIDSTVIKTLQAELDELPKVPYTYTITPTDTGTAAAVTETRYREANARERWDHLRSRFEKKDGVSAILDYGKLIKMRLIDDGTLEQQLNAMQDLRSKCQLNEHWGQTHTYPVDTL